jgi:N-hydroxyarylamine O-acetyltransferase
VDADALLRRIGLGERPPADWRGLAEVHRAFVSRIPYENLTIQLGQARPLDIDDVAERVLHGGRGGYCFELNGLLAALLEALGFRVERRESVIGDRRAPGPTNHLALVVHAEVEWLAEAGYGEGWLEPLWLRPSVHAAETDGFSWAVEREPGGGWWVAQHPWGSTAGVNVAPGEVTLRAFDEHHQRLSCAPDSPFVNILLVQQPHLDRIVTLRSRTLTVRGPHVDEHRTLTDAADLAHTLRAEFAIDPDPLDIDLLWAKVSAQHQLWLQSRGEA